MLHTPQHVYLTNDVWCYIPMPLCENIPSLNSPKIVCAPHQPFFSGQVLKNTFTLGDRIYFASTQWWSQSMIQVTKVANSCLLSWAWASPQELKNIKHQLGPGPHVWGPCFNLYRDTVLKLHHPVFCTYSQTYKKSPNILNSCMKAI